MKRRAFLASIAGAAVAPMLPALPKKPIARAFTHTQYGLGFTPTMARTMLEEYELWREANKLQIKQRAEAAAR